MRFALSLLLAALPLAGVAAQESSTADRNSQITLALEDRHADQLANGFTSITDHRPGDAVATFDQIIAAYEAERHEGRVLCAKDDKQALEAALLELGETSLRGTITVLGPNWCAALFGKGFALIELGRSDEAEPYLARAVEMAPMNAHYVNELAELYKSRREWQRSYDTFARAYDLTQAPFSNSSKRMVARALRGMGYNKVELGDLAGAKELFLRSLEHDPDSPVAKSELEYIASQLKQES